MSFQIIPDLQELGYDITSITASAHQCPHEVDGSQRLRFEIGSFHPGVEAAHAATATGAN